MSEIINVRSSRRTKNLSRILFNIIILIRTKGVITKRKCPTFPSRFEDANHYERS